MNPFVDKYFSKSKRVAEVAGLNPIVKYRIFTRFDGIAAFTPMAALVKSLTNYNSNIKVSVLKTGTEFKAKETIAVIEGPFQDLVEIETMYLQWAALPAYCALQAKKIMEVSKDKIVSDFAARHLFDPTSVALASYGASVGGIPSASTDVGANATSWFRYMQGVYKEILENVDDYGTMFSKPGIGTSPHALLAIFNGDYIAMSEAYRKAFPEDHFIALIDYNNREIDDSLKLLKHHGKYLAGVRIDTCGENHAQVGYTKEGTPVYADERGVSLEAVRGLKNALIANGGEHVKVFVSSGFDAEKVQKFMANAPHAFDGIGTGSFIPKVPQATSDIFMVNGKVETKIGREWGAEDVKLFESKELEVY